MPEIVTLGESMAVLTPRTSEPLRYVTELSVRVAGAESNFAIGVQKLGHSAGWVSRLGDDELGHLVLNRVRAEGVDTSRVVMDRACPTGLMLKDTSLRETKIFYYRENSAASRLAPEDLDETYIAGAKLLHLTGVTPALSDSCLAAARRGAKTARAHGVTVSFDPNIRRKLWKERDFRPALLELLGEADVVLIGLDEAGLLFNTKDAETAFAAVFSHSRAKAAAVKDGANGAWISDGKTAEKLPPFEARCVDPVGAGDAFDAGFVAGLLEGRPLHDCGRMGGIMGAMAVQTTGDTEGLPSREELLRCLEGRETAYR